jgi:hypothetical protein
MKNNLHLISIEGLGTTFAQSVIQAEIEREQPVVLFEPCGFNRSIDFAMPTMEQLLISKQNALSCSKGDYLKQSKHNNRKKKKRKSK